MLKVNLKRFMKNWGNNMLTCNVQITDESIKKLTKVRAIDALSEAIWNAIDANANIINITTKYNETTGQIVEIVIEDDGDGIPYNKFNDYFTLFQKSWKANERRSNNKLYHGKKGEGRFKLYTLANTIVWETSYSNNDKFEKYSITGNQFKMKTFEISENVSSSDKKGTVVYLTNLTDKSVNLNSYSLHFDLISIFALYLESDKSLTINLNGESLDPSTFIVEEKKGFFNLDIENESIEVKYRFIVWNNEFKYTNNKHVYFFDEDNNYIIEKASGVQGNILPHTVFLNSRYFNVFDGLFEEYDGKVDKIRKKYHQDLIEFLFFVKRKYSKEEFSKFVNEQYYPYHSQPNDFIESAQKDIFDLCAFKILEEDPKVLNKKNHSLVILFKFLKKVIEKDENIASIVSEVLDLEDQDKLKFTQILESTSLPKLISHYDEIKRRLIFLNILDELVHEDFYKKHLKERSQLHKIIEKEIWIFGDKFSKNIGTSDQSLDAVVKENFKINSILEDELLELEEQLKIAKKEDTETLLKKIPDLYLWNNFHNSNEEIINNLVVELKAPKVKIGFDEINQINIYRRGIMENTRHRVNNSNRWTYYVISSELNNKDTFKSEFVNYDTGLLWDKDNIRVYAKTWESIIKQSRKELEKTKKELEIKISKTEQNDLLEKYLDSVDFKGTK